MASQQKIILSPVGLKTTTKKERSFPIKKWHENSIINVSNALENIEITIDEEAKDSFITPGSQINICILKTTNSENTISLIFKGKKSVIYINGSPDIIVLDNVSENNSTTIPIVNNFNSCLISLIKISKYNWIISGACSFTIPTIPQI